MGNMPNKWIGRGVALAIAIFAGVGGWFLGRAAGDKLAFGFTFDWYVHDVYARYDIGHVLTTVSAAATLGALLSLAVLAGVTAWATRFIAKRVGYTPPQLRQANGLDTHAAKIGLLLGQVGLIAALFLYVYFTFPVEWTNGALRIADPYGDIKASGYSLLIAVGASAGAAIGAFLTVSTTYSGILDGHIIRDPTRNLLGHISIFGVRNAKATVALVIIATLVAGFAATSVTTNVDVADVLPRGDPNTIAAHNLTEKFKSSFTQAVTFQFRAIDPTNGTQMRLYENENSEKLPNRVTDRGGPNDPIGRPHNITDELYIRAMAEATEFFTSQDPFVGSVAAADMYRLINWTIAGASNKSLNRQGDRAYHLPPTDERGSLDYATVEAGVVNVPAVYAAVDALTSPDWKQTAILVTVDPNTETPSKVIGTRALQIRDEWVQRVAEGKTEYAIFGPENPPQFTVDLPIANAHASELTTHDFKLLLPIIAAFIAITLFIAFRDIVSVVVTFSALTVAVVWTFGAMGALEIPLNTLNLAVVPLIMGIGIDYGIHMMNEYHEYRSAGKSAEEAWTAAGRGSAFALFIGALTTIAGLTVMIISPSLLVAQLGILGVVALASCYLLAIIFIPAAVTLMGGGKAKKASYSPSRIMPAIATGVSRTRILVVIVVLLLAGSAYASSQNIRREAFGDPPRNWLEDDPLRQEHEEALKGFYNTPTDDVKANILIIEGDMTDPRVHDYISGLTATLRTYGTSGLYPIENGTAPSRVIPDTLKDLPFLLNTYLTVKDGAPGAGTYLGGTGLGKAFADRGFSDPTRLSDSSTDPYPKTKAEMEELLDEVFESPLYQLGNLFIDSPEYGMSVIVFSVKAATYEDSESVWNEIQSAIAANEALRPEGTQTSYFGNTAINYLFVAKQVPWLAAMNYVTIGLIVVVVGLMTRKLLPTIVVGTVASLTSILWLGLLPTGPIDIGMAINLTLPLIFISAMGSDYALHLALRCQSSKDTHHTMESVGKGVLFSFVTTVGAFLVFTQISDLAGRRSIIGTVLAIAVVFAVSIIVIPVFYPVKRSQREGGASRPVPVVERRAAKDPQPIAIPVKRTEPPS